MFPVSLLRPWIMFRVRNGMKLRFFVYPAAQRFSIRKNPRKWAKLRMTIKHENNNYF